MSNEMQAIKQQYAGCNLLMPAYQEVQLNPFYKITVMEVTADLSENSGDVFKVGSTKKSQNGRDIWIPTFSPAKPLLMKLAAAAGIQFDPEHTYGTRIDSNTYKAKAYGAMRMPDGTGKTHADEKVICLDDEEANFKLEFMDKSIKGIMDEKAAKAASELFAGKWIDTVDKWNKKCRAYVIDDVDREKYISRSVLVNMTLLRKTAAEKAMTGAINRVIRALTGLKGQYTTEELSKPFAIPRVSFSPDFNDPSVKQLMLSQGMNSIGSLFGTPAIPEMKQQMRHMEEDLFNADEFIDNPAFSSDQVEEPEESTRNETYEQPTEQKNATQSHCEQEQSEGYACGQCGKIISEKVYEYSINKFDMPLCVICQKGAH